MKSYEVERFDETVITVKVHTVDEYENDLALYGARILFDLVEDDVRFMDTSDSTDKERYLILHFESDTFHELELLPFYNLVALYLCALNGGHTEKLLHQEVENIINGNKDSV